MDYNDVLKAKSAEFEALYHYTFNSELNANAAPLWFRTFEKTNELRITVLEQRMEKRTTESDQRLRTQIADDKQDIQNLSDSYNYDAHMNERNKSQHGTTKRSIGRPSSSLALVACAISKVHRIVSLTIMLRCYSCIASPALYAESLGSINLYSFITVL